MITRTSFGHYLGIFIALGLTMLAGCKKDPNADIKDIPYRADFRRTDSLMYAAAKVFHQDSTQKMTAVYPKYLQTERDFWWEFSGEVVRAHLANVPEQRLTNGFKDSLIMAWADPFLRDSAGYAFLDTIQRVFPNNQVFEEALTPLFKRVRKNLPKADIPKIRTHVSGYDPRVADPDVTVMTPHYLSIGLHYLLGDKCRYYPPQIPNYITRRLDKKFLPVLVANDLADRFVARPQKNTGTLIDKVVYQGIRMYVIDKLLPNEPDSMKLYYTEKQMYWADYYEEKIYKEIVPQLFSTDFIAYRKFLDEKPYTSDLSMESAPRLGQYFGWKVVSSYMENHPNITLEQLCEIQNYEQIFKESKYKP